MSTILLIILLLIIFGGGGGYYVHGRYGGAGLGGVLGWSWSSCLCFGWSARLRLVSMRSRKGSVTDSERRLS